MKASIVIMGEVGGNSRLKGYITSEGLHLIVRTQPFGGYEIFFNTCGDAKRALRSAYRSLKVDNRGSHVPMNLTRDGKLLYDASTATLWPRPEWRGVGSNS
jgi:hypothetical protein